MGFNSGFKGLKQKYPKADDGKLFTKCLPVVVTALIILVDWGVIDPKKRQYRKSFLWKFVNEGNDYKSVTEAFVFIDWHI